MNNFHIRLKRLTTERILNSRDKVAINLIASLYRCFTF